MSPQDIKRARWRKSGRSGGNGNCVEVGPVDDIVGVRDTKGRDRLVLAFKRAAWTSFVEGAKAGEFDLVGEG